MCVCVCVCVCCVCVCVCCVCADGCVCGSDEKDLQLTHVVTGGVLCTDESGHVCCYRWCAVY